MVNFDHFSEPAYHQITTKFTRKCRKDLQELCRNKGKSLEIIIDENMESNDEYELAYWSTVTRYSKSKDLVFIRVLLKNEKVSFRALSGFIKKMSTTNILDKIYFVLEDINPRTLNTDLFPRFREEYLLNISVNCKLVQWYTNSCQMIKRNQIRLLELRQATIEQVKYVVHNREHFHMLKAYLIERLVISENKNIKEGISRAKKEKKSVILVTYEEQNSKVFDCFLSHNWGEGAMNHKKIKELEIELEEHGVNCWLDEKNMQDHLNQMRTGIDDSKVFFAFITNDYLKKAFTNDTNIRKEYNHAINQSKPFVIIHVETIKDEYQIYLEKMNKELKDKGIPHIKITDSCFTKENIKELIEALEELT